MEKLLGGINIQAYVRPCTVSKNQHTFAINLFPTSYYNPLEGGTI